MLTAMSSVTAYEIVATEYPGASKPISKTGPARTQSLDWWLENPRQEMGWSERKTDALRAIFRIVQESNLNLPPRTFPALFEFSDGKIRWPDKGQVKALVTSGRLAVRMESGEMVFQLTEHPENQEFHETY